MTAQLTEDFEYLETCCMHDVQWRPADVADVIIAHEYSGKGYGSTDNVTIVRLHDGGWSALISCSDTTGHGCRCESQTVRADTLHHLLTHIEDSTLVQIFKGDHGDQS